MGRYGHDLGSNTLSSFSDLDPLLFLSGTGTVPFIPTHLLMIKRQYVVQSGSGLYVRCFEH